MNKKNTRLPNAWLKKMAVMLILVIAGGITKVSAQCRFVTTSESGEKLVVELPASFPIYHYLNDHKLEDEQFAKSLAAFNEKNPGFSHVIFKPVQIPHDPGTFIEVPESYLASLSKEDREAILFATFYYKVTQI